MEDKYQNKYRIASARWQLWDYGWDAAYFIKICTKDRQHYFGEITDGKMALTSVGTLADVFWHEIKNHASNVGLGAFVVMPNHIHGILVLDGNGANVEGNGRNTVNANDGNGGRNSNVSNVGGNDNNVDGNDDNVNGNDDNVETRHALSLPFQPDKPDIPNPSNQSIQPDLRNPGQNRFQNQGKNTISSIVGGYKSAVTKHANRMGLEMGWQTRFHDHVIRDEPSFIRITDYINTNPQNWSDDRFYN